MFILNLKNLLIELRLKNVKIFLTMVTNYTYTRRQNYKLYLTFVFYFLSINIIQLQQLSY